MLLNSPRMRRLSLALAGFALGAQADPGAAIQERIYAKLAASFAVTEAPGPGGEFLLLTPLGVPLGLEQTRNPDALFKLLDQIPSPSRQYVPSGRSFSSVYKAILQFSDVTRYQNQAALNRVHDLKRLLRDRRRPGRPSPQYAAYLKYKADYLGARDALATAQAEQRASGRPVPLDLEGRLARAARNWTTLGNRKLIEDAFEYLRKACETNVRVLFNELDREMFYAGLQASGPLGGYPLETNPPIATWLEDAGWQRWSYRAADAASAAAPAQPARPPEAAPAVSPKWLETLAMTAQLKRVSITRPWLDLSIFHSRAWRLPPVGAFATVSTGNPQDPAPGVMPLVVTGALLARDLSVTGAWDAAGSPAIPRSVGPFALASPATTQNLPLHPYVASYGGSLAIRVEGTQIIGFFCEAVPKSPSPDPKFFR